MQSPMLRGWRGWSIEIDYQGIPSLRGHKFDWPSNVYMANCHGDRYQCLKHLTEGKCKCGINAFWTIGETVSQFNHYREWRLDAIGLTQFSGKVRLGSLGLRGSDARIEHLLIRKSHQITNRVLFGLAWRYFGIRQIVLVNEWPTIEQSFAPAFLANAPLWAQWAFTFDLLAQLKVAEFNAPINALSLVWLGIEHRLGMIETDGTLTDTIAEIERILARS